MHKPSDILPLRPVVANEDAAEDNNEGDEQSFIQIRDLRDWTYVDREKENYSQAVCYLAGYIAKKVTKSFNEKCVETMNLY